MFLDIKSVKYSIIILLIIIIVYKKKYIDIDKKLYTKKQYKIKQGKLVENPKLSHKIIDSCRTGLIAGAVAGGLTGGLPGSITGCCVYSMAAGINTYINYDKDMYDSDSDSESE
jgi:hypothetical protein